MKIGGCGVVAILVWMLLYGMVVGEYCEGMCGGCRRVWNCCGEISEDYYEDGDEVLYIVEGHG